MIIWTTKPEVEKEVTIPYMGIRSWKWTLSILEWFDKDHDTFVLIDKTNSFRCENHYKPNEWRDLHQEGFMVTISKWQWGEDHLYYDGNHCMLHVGWLHFEWSNPKCKKCLDA